MAAIYDLREETLERLLEAVSSGSSNSGVLRIPDLQRPYVWRPHQVTLLMDSLIRGWPFGGLVLWRVPPKEQGHSSIPSRSFWNLVDRRSEGAEGGRFPEASFGDRLLVLDGQQRLQSLALALVDDLSGFKLPDRQWFESLEIEKRPKRPGAHWTRGQLYLDLGAFGDEFDLCQKVRQIDYARRALVWAVGDAEDAESPKRRPDNYLRPLRFAGRLPDKRDAGSKRHLVRLNRLWDLATTEESRIQREVAETFLRDVAGIPKEVIARILTPMSELLAELGQLKRTKVGILEIQPRRSGMSEAEYSDSVVNIFTRLNTAGRQLTRQEITFAWIKQDWDKSKTDQRKAEECFEDLRADLKRHGIALHMDDVVQVVAIVWAVLFNKGQLLQSSDLLEQAKIKPMAAKLVEVWNWLPAAIRQTAVIVDELGLRFGRHFESVNAFALLAAWRAAGTNWVLGGKSHVARDGHQVELDARLRASAERWLVMSQWAGVWSAGRKALEDRAVELAKTVGELGEVASIPAASSVLHARLEGWVADLRGDARKYVDAMGVEHRDEVAQYRTPLWIWHRLSEARWKQSQVSIPNRKQEPELDVDHLVPVSLWKDLLGPDPEYAGQEGRAGERDEDLNAIGNCALLDKAYNISKSGKALGAFLQVIKDSRPTEFDPAEWKAALSIQEAQVDPAKAKEALRQASQARTELLKADLHAWIDGTLETDKSRPFTAPDAPARTGA